MRVILFIDGAIVNNTIDVNLTPGQYIGTSITIPGYIPGTLEAFTDLSYEINILGDQLELRFFVPEDYGASGQTEIPISYATTSILGNLVYDYDVTSGNASRSVTITNNAGSDFSSEIAIAEDQDVYDALGSDQILYGIVGNLDVGQGTHTYSIPTNLTINIVYNIFPATGNTNMSLDVSINAITDPLPGVMTIHFADENVTFNMTSRYSQISIPERVVAISTISPNEYMISSYVSGIIRVMDTTARNVTKDGMIVPFTTMNGDTSFDATTGIYILTK